VDPAPICKAKPKQRKGEHRQPGKSQANSASKRDADYEHAGVAIAVHRKWVKLVEEVRELSGRNMTVILKTGIGDLALTATYGPTAEASDKNKNTYWDELSKEMESNKNCIRIVAGDFNARLYEIQDDEKRCFGTNILHRD